jgi:hypothetical protein
MLAGGAVLLIVFLGLLYGVLRAPDSGPDGLPQTDQSSEVRLETYLAEKERASAYEVVRDHLDLRSKEPGIAAVYCRDCSHRWVAGEIEFRGDVDFQDHAGRLQHHTYVAVLSGSSQEGWSVEDVTVKPKKRGLP